MAFQAMNHGLEARATSPPTMRATLNPRADSLPEGSGTFPLRRGIKGDVTVHTPPYPAIGF